MLLEPEGQAENIFARMCVAFDCDVKVLERDSEVWQ